jgi:hypothetical protein
MPVRTERVPEGKPVQVEAGAVAVVAIAPIETAEPLPAGSDEAGESAFLAEARQRGETFSAPVKVEEIEPANGSRLPPLAELVAKIPPEVRETLEELFRAKFVTVRRVPKKALKE